GTRTRRLDTVGDLAGVGPSGVWGGSLGHGPGLHGDAQPGGQPRLGPDDRWHPGPHRRRRRLLPGQPRRGRL
ncbi:MAG: hypothetical protein AVDCRST_MAG70-207, partial [uncultured Thermomicrobiales bacterium]